MQTINWLVTCFKNGNGGTSYNISIHNSKHTQKHYFGPFYLWLLLLYNFINGQTIIYQLQCIYIVNTFGHMVDVVKVSLSHVDATEK